MDRAQKIDFMVYSKSDFLDKYKKVTPAEYAGMNKGYKTWKAVDDAEQETNKTAWFELIDGYWKEPEMQAHFRKETARVVKLDCGRYIEIEKPRIHTDFCFGYHTYDDSFNGAEGMAQHVTEDGGEYFVRRNLKDIDEKIHELETGSRYEYSRGEKGYSFGEHWYNSPDALGYYMFVTPTYWEDRLMEERRSNAIPLTANDIANLLKAYKLVRLDFMKRLNTYLKKYGTSKLHTWTYWEDE